MIYGFKRAMYPIFKQTDTSLTSHCILIDSNNRMMFTSSVAPTPYSDTLIDDMDLHVDSVRWSFEHRYYDDNDYDLLFELTLYRSGYSNIETSTSHIVLSKTTTSGSENYIRKAKYTNSASLASMDLNKSYCIAIIKHRPDFGLYQQISIRKTENGSGQVVIVYDNIDSNDCVGTNVTLEIITDSLNEIENNTKLISQTVSNNTREINELDADLDNINTRLGNFENESKSKYVTR